MIELTELEKFVVKRRESLISEFLRLYSENSLTLEKAYGIAAVLKELRTLENAKEHIIADLSDDSQR